MSYLGNTPTTQSFISGTDYFNGTGSQTAFTLSRTVASINDIQVTVNNVVQQPNSGYTISGTTLTFDQAPSAGTQNVYVRYLSTTTQVITPSQNTVSWNTLDTNTQNDLGLMYKNKIINGAMTFDQRNAGASVSAIDNAFQLDRWKTTSYDGTAQTGKFTVQQDAGGVTPPAGFTDYLGVTSSAVTSLGSGAEYLIGQNIEGFNTADLGWGTANAKTITLSFWVRSSLTGTFGGSLRNGDVTRSYPFSYTIATANTWEYKTITVVGDVTGTWLTNNNIGIRLVFGLGVGSALSGTAGAWVGANRISVTGAVNVLGTNGATFYLTGVQFEVGTQATAFSTAGGSYGAELALCQRYLPAWTAPGSAEGLIAAGGCANTTVGAFTVIYPVTTRVPPTGVSVTNATHFSTWFTTSVGVGTGISFAGRASTQACQINLTTSGLTTGAAASLGFNSNATSSSVFLLTGCEL